MDDDDSGIKHPTSDAEILKCFDFARKYAKSYARSKNMLRNDLDEAESIAGEAATVAMRDWRGEGTFAGMLKHIIRNMILKEHSHRSGKLQSAIRNAEPLPDHDLPMHWRPSSARPAPRERKS